MLVKKGCENVYFEQVEETKLGIRVVDNRLKVHVTGRKQSGKLRRLRWGGRWKSFEGKQERM